MDESYGTAPVTPPDESESSEQPESMDEETDTATTTIVPNKILSPEGEPLKTGDEIVVRVVKNYGDESEIEYAPKEGASDTTEESSATESTPEEDFSAMDKEGGY